MRLVVHGKLGGYAIRAHGPDAVGQMVFVKGRAVYFDFDEYGGPLVTNKSGEPLVQQPVSESDPFWPPFNAWLAHYWKAKASA